jgi:hypothetical protein
MFLDTVMCEEVDNDKLIEIMEERDVKISKNGNICLNDFIKNVVKSKNPTQYAKRLDCNVKTVNGKSYITPG